MSRLNDLLLAMASINEPFELFEPYLWYDKLGDSCWKCQINSVDATLWSGEGDTPLEAVERCYAAATAPSPNTEQVEKK